MNPRALCPILFVTAVAACQSNAHVPIAKTHGDAGSLVRVAGGNLTIGFAEGRLTGTAALDGFSISKTPVTAQQFESCVTAGVCSWSDASCSNPGASDADVALCVGFDSAQAYCSWVGGRLPSLPEWLLAARGPSVRRFPWGDAMATCAQHPGAKAPPGQLLSREDAEFQHKNGYCGVGADGLLRTGEHPTGASVSGVEDVLLSGGELVRGDDASVLSVCLSEKSGCVVFGLVPGAIDAVESVGPPAKTAHAPAATVSHPYGFRCVKTEEAR